MIGVPRMSNLPGWRSLVNRPVIAGAAILAAIARLYFAVWVYRPPNVQLDFSCYYVWGAAIRRHIDPYRVDLLPLARSVGVIIQPIRYANYPPTSLLLFSLFAAMKPVTAYWVWIVLNLLLLGTVLFLLLARSGLPVCAALVAAAAAVLYRPLQIHFQFAQTQILVLVLLVLVMRAARVHRDAAAGTVLGVVGLFKIYPLFLGVFFMCNRRWKALASAAVTVLLGGLLTVVLLGRTATGFLDKIGYWLAPEGAPSWLSKVSLPSAIEWFAEMISNRGPGAFSESDLMRWLVLASALVLCGFPVAAALRARTRGVDLDNAFGLMVATMVLIIPNSWPHYMVLLLLPLVQLAIAAYQRTAPRSAVALGASAYIVAELSWSTAYFARHHARPGLASVLIEGLFVSTLMVYLASYFMVISEVRDKASGSKRVSDATTLTA